MTTTVFATVAMTLGKKRTVVAEVIRHKNKKKEGKIRSSDLTKVAQDKPHYC